MRAARRAKARCGANYQKSGLRTQEFGSQRCERGDVQWCDCLLLPEVIAAGVMGVGPLLRPWQRCTSSCVAVVALSLSGADQEGETTVIATVTVFLTLFVLAFLIELFRERVQSRR